MHVHGRKIHQRLISAALAGRSQSLFPDGGAPHERGSLVVTSNKSFADWGEVFNDQLLATAILDRLLHHATTLNIKGESYRLREKKKAGLLGRHVIPMTEEVIPDASS
jgi:IstB-like ATP binding protein